MSEKEKVDAHVHLLPRGRLSRLFGLVGVEGSLRELESLWRRIYGGFPDRVGLIVYPDQLPPEIWSGEEAKGKFVEGIRDLARKVENLSVAVFVPYRLAELRGPPGYAYSLTPQELLERLKSALNLENVGYKVHLRSIFRELGIPLESIIQAHTPSAFSILTDIPWQEFFRDYKGHMAHGVEIFRIVWGEPVYPWVSPSATLGFTSREGNKGPLDLGEKGLENLAEKIDEVGGRIYAETDYPFRGPDFFFEVLREWKWLAKRYKILPEKIPHIPLWLLK